MNVDFRTFSWKKLQIETLQGNFAQSLIPFCSRSVPFVRCHNGFISYLPVKIFVEPTPGVLVLLRELAPTTKRVHTKFYKFEYNFSPSISQLMSSHMKTCTDLNLYEVICLHNYLSFFCRFLDFIYSFLRGSRLFAPAVSSLCRVHRQKAN